MSDDANGRILGWSQWSRAKWSRAKWYRHSGTLALGDIGTRGHWPWDMEIAAFSREKKLASFGDRSFGRRHQLLKNRCIEINCRLMGAEIWLPN
jgi:hypothetical protein